MALLGTKARDEYYRNDSPVGDLLANCRCNDSEQLGVHILKYCRRKEEKKKRKSEKVGRETKFYTCALTGRVWVSRADALRI